MTRDSVVKVDCATFNQAHDERHGRHDFRQRREIKDGVVAGGKRAVLVSQRAEGLTPERPGRHAGFNRRGWEGASGNRRREDRVDARKGRAHPAECTI